MWLVTRIKYKKVTPPFHLLFYIDTYTIVCSKNVITDYTHVMYGLLPVSLGDVALSTPFSHVFDTGSVAKNVFQKRQDQKW